MTQVDMRESDRFETRHLEALFDLMAFFAAGIILVSFLDWLFSGLAIRYPSLPFMIAVNSAVAGFFLLLASALLWRRRIRWRDIGLAWPESLTNTLFWGWILFGSAFAFFASLELIQSTFSIQFDQSPVDESAQSSIPRLTNQLDAASPIWFMLYMLGPYAWLHVGLFEEMMMRGFVFQRMEQCLDWMPGSVCVPLVVVLQGIIFGAIHIRGQGMEGFLVIGILGIIVGAIYVASGRNLWAVAFGHGLGTMVPMMQALFSQ